MQTPETNLKASVFKNYLNGERISNTTIGEVARMIREGDYATAISDYRCASLPMLGTALSGEHVRNAVNTADNRIPRLCFATEYRRHKACRKLVRRNALAMLEIDDIADFTTAAHIRSAAARQPYTMMAFIGANGRSVVIVCRVSLRNGSVPSDDEAYRNLMAEGYRRMHYVYSSQLNVNIPMLAPYDDAMCLMSVDDNAFYDPDAIAVYVTPKDAKAIFGGIKRTRDDDVSPLPGKNVDEANRYIFYSCWDKVLDSGLNTLDPYFAEKAIMLLAKYCHRSGLPQQCCVDRASSLELINADTDLITMLFNQAYGNNLIHTHPTGHVATPSLVAMKVDNFFRKRFRLRRNELTGVVQYKPLGAYDTDYRPVTRAVVNTMAIMAQREGIKIWARDMKERVESTLIETFNPVNEYINSLPQWDGRDRLSAFAARVPTDNPHWTEFFSVWMRSMMAVWTGIDRNHGNAIVPLLIGPQGCGKTSFTKIILPPDLQEYYNDRIDFKNDNTMMLGLSSFALINIDEFDSYSVRRQPLMKYLISKNEVTTVKAYGNTFSTTRRYASFIGTTNNPHPLTDITGSRRFVCANITGKIDTSSPVDYGQLYAQVAYGVRCGLARYLDEDATRRLAEANRPFIRLNDLDSILLNMFRQPSSDSPSNELSAANIAALIRREYPDFPPARLSSIEVGKRLSANGFQHRHTRNGTLYAIEMKSEKE